jgi:peptidoglycan/xylan/chitin deacetylase (PgdA/CDA1 family)
MGTKMEFRLDRLATLYVASPLRRMRSEAVNKIPILMYHSIAREDESRVAAYYRTATSPEMFSRQMAALSKAGYTSISLADAIQTLQNGSECPSKKMVITFDDGFRNFYDDAFPVLSRFGYDATMFLPTNYIGDSRKQFKGKDCLTWSEVRELRKCGMSFGSHTTSHPKLYGMKKNQIAEEVTKSKSSVEQAIGEKVTSFAYPYAFPEFDCRFKNVVTESLANAGYSEGVVTTLGRASASSNRYFLERLPVNSCDDEALLLAKMDGAYDWTGKPQQILKKIKSWGTSSAGANY